MEVNNDQFQAQLLPILKQIANAKFVSFDLEMSGISSRSRYGPNPQGHDNGKPTLQKLYDETRAAAEKYQILQVGVTLVEEDREKGKLLLTKSQSQIQTAMVSYMFRM
jgi:poly(A)-specific ribonuclease